VQIEKRKLAELSLDPKNARKHNKKNLEAIKGSLTKFGQQKPIVVTKENIIIAGNGTYAAAKELGWTELDVVVSTLDAVNQKAFALADNRTAELAEWDDDFLSDALKGLGEIKFDLGDIGFDEIFVESHVRKPFEFHPPEEKESEEKEFFNLKITLESEDEQQKLFSELVERGFKVKV